MNRQEILMAQIPITWTRLTKKNRKLCKSCFEKKKKTHSDAEVLKKALLFLLPTLIKIHSQCPGQRHTHILPEAPACLICTFPGSLSRSVCIMMNSECAPQTIPKHQKRNGSAAFFFPGL